MGEKFNILYWNINYRTYGTTEIVQTASKIVMNELNKYISFADAVVLTEAYPQIDEKLNYNHIDLSFIKSSLEKNGYIVNPYNVNNYEMNLIKKIESEKKINDLKINFMTEDGFIPFKTKRYENSIMIAVKNKHQCKLVDYNCIYPNFLSIYLTKYDLLLSGIRICIGNKCKIEYSDAKSIFEKNPKLKLYAKSFFEQLSKEDEVINDNIVRRAQYEYIKKTTLNYPARHKVLIGDFNIDKEFNKKSIWDFNEIVNNNEMPLKTTVMPTIGKNNKDYIYTTKKDIIFFVLKEMKDMYSINTEIIDYSVKSPFPDHNLLFASIDLGD